MHDAGTAGIGDTKSWSALSREIMVDRQIRPFGVTDQRLLARMLEVPREHFLPAEQASLAYSDLALRLKPAVSGGDGRELLPPLVLARLIQGAEVAPGDNVLDIAPGTGYSSAILAGLAAGVVALESEQAYYERLWSNLEMLKIANAQAQMGPLAVGAPDDGPFNVILINGRVEANLEALFAQLKGGGRLVAIDSVPGDFSSRAGKGVRYDKTGDGSTIGCRTFFDAGAALLRDFKRAEQFTFS